MGMALDELQEGDEVFKEKGFTFMINKQLLDEVQPIKVDFIDTPRGSGYFISANITSAGCGSCSCG
jgi:Fe-S cluster assembly iron-binding protein IscA